ncbi:hypothetical protein D3Y59_10110 [Hymenobacter oligotrophus]|uniref:DUF4133 domain-containing protein n=2 Tax=Cytophagales TaxID=768507 RepID=A0A3B7R1S8_9BACT|nr:MULTISPECIES: hypothetical protein [Cytophagales]AYA37373.1 hypothetical protein D3Y59_10110 [Hymenobacter oligotrophus]KUG09334.1 hypothetical protein ASU33_16490 [Solirubrum puertoriconensis]
MRKQILVAGLLVLSAAGASAQTNPSLPEKPAPPIEAAPQVAAKNDSVQAVQTLFRKRRNGGTVFTAIGSLVLLRGVLASGDASGVAVSGAVAAPFLAVGIGKLARFGSKKEDAYIKQYQQGKPLPAYIRKRLRPEYFRAR